MVRFISPFLRMALFLVLFALVACSDDSSSSASSEGVARYTVIIYGQNGGDMEGSIEATMKDVRDVIGDEKMSVSWSSINMAWMAKTLMEPWHTPDSCCSLNSRGIPTCLP